MFRRFILAVLLAGLGGGQALAHARLLHANPKVGSTVMVAPAELQLVFSEAIDPAASKVSVAGPAGPVATGALSLDPRDRKTVHVPLVGRLAPGRYTVRWGMTSVDTHHTDGDFTFKIAP